MPDYSEIPTENLKDMVLRHEKKKVTNTPEYRSAVEELARRQSTALKTEVTIAHLIEHARKEEFTSYGAVADANGAEWSKVHWQVTDHLDYILQICNMRGWPLLTAICVNKENIETGDLAESSLSGFVKGAQRLGHTVTDHQQFLKDCQKASFDWGKTN